MTWRLDRPRERLHDHTLDHLSSGVGHEVGSWRATPAPESRVVFHHASERVLSAHPTLEDVYRQVRIVEDWHAMTLTKEPRIGYHWIAVQQRGWIVEGLGWSRIGAHVGRHNTSSLGILILGLDGARGAGTHAPWPLTAHEGFCAMHEFPPSPVVHTRQHWRGRSSGLVSPLSHPLMPGPRTRPGGGAGARRCGGVSSGSFRMDQVIPW